MIGDALNRGLIQLNHGVRVPGRQVFCRLAIFDGGFDEKPVQLKAANEPFEVTGERERGHKTFQVTLVAVGKAFPGSVHGAIPVASHVKAAVVGEAKLFDITEKRCFFVVRNKLISRTVGSV
jgi:hypothetical protein